MKKISLLLLLSMLLSGCTNSNTKDVEDLKIICPTGAPALAFYNEATNKNFETNSSPSNIVSMMSNDSIKDIIVIDTISGIQAINRGANFKLAATITFGNFYLVSTGNDTNNTMDATDKIVLFGKNQTPDYLFHYIYGNTYDNSIEWVSNVQEAAKCVKTSKNLITGSLVDYVFIAEPVLSIVKTPNTTIYANIQEKYMQTSNNMELIQASVFVNNNLDSNIVNTFLSNLKTNITNLNNNHLLLQTSMNSLTEKQQESIYGISSSNAINVIDKLGLGYKKAIDNKEAIDNYVKLFGEDITNEEIYYK